MAARRRRTGLWAAIAIVAVVIIGVVGYLGFVGGGTTLRTGTQNDVCGVKVGVLAAGDAAELSWTDGGASLAVGERARLTPWCLLEVESIEPTAEGSTKDGGGGSVAVRWRLW